MSLKSPLRNRSTTTAARPSGRNEMLAAQRVNIANPQDQRYVQTLVRSTKIRDESSWEWYDKIGEVHYAVSRAGRIAGYTRLFAEHQTAEGKWEEVEVGQAADIVAGIYSPYGGVRGLISRFFTLMKVPADSWLIRVKDEDGDYDGYHFMSVDEIDASSTEALTVRDGNPIRWITMPSQSGTDGERTTRTVAAEDFLGRVWVPSNRWVDVPDSPLGALATECEVLFYSTLNLKAKLKSRFATAGIFFVPDKMNGAVALGGESKPQNIDDVLDYLIKAMSRNVRDFEDAVAYLPIIMSGPGDVADQIRHIVMDREILTTDIEIRRELIDRILTGLDIQQQATKGVGEATHWSAWAVTDEELRLVAKPDVQNAAWAMTRLILHRQLLEGGMRPDEILRHRIGFEMTEAASKTNQQEDARQLNDRGELNGETMRAVAGFDAEHAMEGDEKVRWVGRQAKNPYMMLFGTPEFDKIDWEMVLKFSGKTGPSGKPGEEPSVGPGVGDPGSPDDNDSDTPRTQRPA